MALVRVALSWWHEKKLKKSSVLIEKIRVHLKR
jgi:hypothetical protein